MKLVGYKIGLLVEINLLSSFNQFYRLVRYDFYQSYLERSFILLDS